MRYRRAWQVLRPGGHLAFWGALHVFPDGGDPFFREIQDVYYEIGEGLPPGENPWPRPGELWDQGLVMEQWKQDRLYGEIRRRLARRPDHSVRRHWG